jgi:hypothetical protein
VGIDGLAIRGGALRGEGAADSARWVDRRRIAQVARAWRRWGLGDVAGSEAVGRGGGVNGANERRWGFRVGGG